MRNGDRMEIDDTKKGVVIMLKLHPVADGAQPIAQMECTGGLDAGKNPRLDH